MYNETAITGTKRPRACRIVIENPLNGLPTVNFVIDEIVSVSGQEISQPLGNVVVNYDPAGAIPVADLATYTLTLETVTHDRLMAILAGAAIQAMQQAGY